MAFTWNSNLETGHPVIDAQHKELINTVNTLLNACHEGLATDKVSETLEFLAMYTKKHFSEEEALQRQSNYPDFVSHRNLHNSFMMAILDLSEELKVAGPTPAVVNNLIRNVGDWLITHIQRQDTKVAAHLKRTGV